MMGDVTASLRIAGLSEKGVRCVATGSVDRPFWLPRASKVHWLAPPQVGQLVGAVIPGWLTSKHKQLGDQALARARRKRNYQRPNKPPQRNEHMAEQRDMSGSLSKNTRKEKPSHSDYTGFMIEGRKYWLNGWVKDGEKGKFLSLSVRLTDEGIGAAKRKPAPADADGIPF
jgi:hypothetical protein